MTQTKSQRNQMNIIFMKVNKKFKIAGGSTL